MISLWPSYIIILTYKFSSKQAPVVEFEPRKSDGIPFSFICTEKKWCGSTSWVLLVIFGSLWCSAWGCSGWPLAPTEKKMGCDVVKDLPYKTLSPVFYTRDSYRVDFLRFYRLEESILFFFRNKHLNVLSQMMNSSWWLSNLSPSLCAGGEGWLNVSFLEQIKRIRSNCLSMPPLDRSISNLHSPTYLQLFSKCNYSREAAWDFSCPLIIHKTRRNTLRG